MFHSLNPTLFGRPAGVLSEAESLLVTIGELRRVSDALIAHMPHATTHARLLLSDFSAQLSTYFDAEENGGYFQTIVTDRADLEPRIAILRATHDRLRDSVASLRRLARNESDSTTLGHGIADVIDALDRHEVMERALLQEFLQGAGDGPIAT
jgi:hypothetical protein